MDEVQGKEGYEPLFCHCADPFPSACYCDEICRYTMKGQVTLTIPICVERQRLEVLLKLHVNGLMMLKSGI